MGGDITVESNPNKGTTFVMRMPTNPAAPQSDARGG